MLRLMSRLGDRMLSALVPQTTAAACVPPEQWVEESNLADCSCRSCHYNCYGAAVCGSWGKWSYCC
jgi:hypothetical protein